MDILPPFIITSAIAAGVTIFGFTMLYFRLPLGRLSGTQRLYLSWLSGAAVWGTLLALQYASFPPMSQALLDFTCGILVYISFIWCNYWVANLGAGFRVRMLLDLANAPDTLSLEEWMARYGVGRGMHAFLDDRLNSILLPMEIVSRDRDIVKLTAGRGAFFAWGARMLAMLLIKWRRHA